MELEISILAARRCLLTFGGIGAFWPLSDLIWMINKAKLTTKRPSGLSTSILPLFVALQLMVN
jgi:hypothetical protein